MPKEMLLFYSLKHSVVVAKGENDKLASRYSISEALHAIINATLEEDYGLFAGELSDEERAKKSIVLPIEE